MILHDSWTLPHEVPDTDRAVVVWRRQPYGPGDGGHLGVAFYTAALGFPPDVVCWCDKEPPLILTKVAQSA